MNMNVPSKGNLILEEEPVLVSPSLATKIGLNEAIVIGQIHHYISLKNVHDYTIADEQQQWVIGSYEEWRNRDFPWWSCDTVKRILTRLENSGLIRSKMHEIEYGNRRKSYTLSYEAIGLL